MLLSALFALPARLSPAGPLPGDWMRALSMCTCGDVDGDGKPDLAIGLPRDDAHGTDAGRVFIVSGKDGQTIRELWTGVEHSGFGFALDGGTDLDGDGKPDLLVSAHRDGFRQHEPNGEVYFFALGGDPKTTPRRIEHETENLGADFGSLIRLVGDVDGDGRSDFIVESRDEALLDDRPTSPLRLFSGRTLRLIRRLGPESRVIVDIVGDVDRYGVLDLAWPKQDQHATVFSTRADRELVEIARGRAFDAGDLDGDGRSDIALVRHELEEEPVNDVLIVSGKTGKGLLLVSESDLKSAGGIASSAQPMTFVVHAIGDVDGDGHRDLIVSLAGASRSLKRSEFAELFPGREYVLGSQACGGAALVSGQTGNVLRVIVGTSVEGLDYDFGQNMAVLGDVDGDHVDDFALGTRESGASEPYEKNPGGVHVCSGKTGALLFAWYPVPGGEPHVYLPKRETK